MWLPDSFCILLKKNNIVIPNTMMFGYWVLDMNTVNLSLDWLSEGLVWCPHNRSSGDRPYFSHDLFRIDSTFFLVVISRLLFWPMASMIVFFDKFLELSLLDQLLYLFFQILAFVSRVTMILMETAVFFWISPLWGRAQWFGLFQCRVVLYLHEDFVRGH